MLRRFFPRFLVALALLLGATSAARAEDDPKAARDHYVKGQKLYDLLRYREAAKEFEAAYEAKPDPAFLYNMAQAYRLAGDKDQAMGAYRSFLRRMPKSSKRAEVEEHIAILQKAIDEERRSRERDPSGTLRPSGAQPAADQDDNNTHPASATTTTPPPSTPAASVTQPTPTGTPSEPAAEATTPPAPTPTTPIEENKRPGTTLKIAGGVIAGVGLAAVATGIVFGLQANSARDEINNAPAGTTFDPSLEDKFNSNRTLAIALCAGGGAAVVGGAVVMALGFKQAKKGAVSVLPTVGAGRVGATLSFGF